MSITYDFFPISDDVLLCYDILHLTISVGV